MARKRTSPFEDLVTLLSRLPWWASLLIGVVSWLILRPVATSPMAAPAGATFDDLSGIMLSQAWRTFAIFGQYLIPLICLFGAIGSIAGRHSRKKLLNNVKSATQPGKAIDGLDWREFEHLIGEAFEIKGCTVTAKIEKSIWCSVRLALRLWRVRPEICSLPEYTHAGTAYSN